MDVHLADTVNRPNRSVVLFFVDGIGKDRFDEALAAGELPNIRKHLHDRGVRIDDAVAVIPSITYANAVTLITGRHPGRHAIISNKWYDPKRKRYKNYCLINTYRDVDRDYPSTPTIHEILADRVTVSLQAAQRRGATHTIDNWATSGINWFFGNYTGVDCLVAQDFELIARRAPRWGTWPEFILAYFPGVDQVGHRHGPKSDAYRRAIVNVDLQIGRVIQALRDAGMYDRTYLCFASDHGMVETSRHFDFSAFLREQCNGRVWSNDVCNDDASARRMLRNHDFALAVSGSRWAAVYALEKPGSPGPLAPMMAALHSQVATSSKQSRPSSEALQSRFPRWVRDAMHHSAVELMACSPQPGEVHLFRGDRHAIVTRTASHPYGYALAQRPGSEVVIPDPTQASGTELSHSDDRFWLRASSDHRYPDLIPQIMTMFETPRAGNLVFFAAEGWDFGSGNSRGGHGSILRGDLRVPLLFSGPGLPHGGRIDVARLTDVMPTMLGFLDAAASLHGKPVPLDGV
ncbi:MAG: alkaline phosphatase family protein, partial [Planctomycetota bacterium]|nr:alkaline phosphatase family protein [Planctomycetota bacterium]